MTREEAVYKITNLAWNNPRSLIHTLEALGLLKFEITVDREDMTARQKLIKEAREYISERDTKVSKLISFLLAELENDQQNKS